MFQGPQVCDNGSVYKLMCTPPRVSQSVSQGLPPSVLKHIRFSGALRDHLML